MDRPQGVDRHQPLVVLRGDLPASAADEHSRVVAEDVEPRMAREELRGEAAHRRQGSQVELARFDFAYEFQRQCVYRFHAALIVLADKHPDIVKRLAETMKRFDCDLKANARPAGQIKNK